jgi:hypothetical protein
MNWILYSIMILGFIPLVLSYIVKPNARDAAIKPFLWLTFAASLYELLALNKIIFLKNWFIIYNAWEFATVAYYFFFILHKKYIKFFIFTALLYSLFYFLSTYFKELENIYISNMFSCLATSILIFGSSILWFLEIFKNLSIKYLWTHPHFIIISSFLIYYAGTFFLMLLSYLILKFNMEFTHYWFINIIATFVFRLLLILGIWKMKPGFR